MFGRGHGLAAETVPPPYEQVIALPVSIRESAPGPTTNVTVIPGPRDDKACLTPSTVLQSAPSREAAAVEPRAGASRATRAAAARM